MSQQNLSSQNLVVDRHLAVALLSLFICLLTGWMSNQRELVMDTEKFVEDGTLAVEHRLPANSGMLRLVAFAGLCVAAYSFRQYRRRDQFTPGFNSPEFQGADIQGEEVGYGQDNHQPRPVRLNLAALSDLTDGSDADWTAEETGLDLSGDVPEGGAHNQNTFRQEGVTSYEGAPISRVTTPSPIIAIPQTAASPPAHAQPRIRAEHQWAHSLIKEPLVLFFGEQGGGKTSKSGWLVGEKLKHGCRSSICDPFSAALAWQGLKVYGRGRNFKEIEHEMEAFRQEAERRIDLRAIDSSYDPFQDQHWFISFDELTNYSEHIDQDVGKAFISTITQFLRQANMSVILAGHGDTLTCLFGRDAGHGKKDVLERQLTKVQVHAKNDDSVPGGLRCSGKALLFKGVGSRPKTVAVPSYMRQPPQGDYRPILQAAGLPIAESPFAQPTVEQEEGQQVLRLVPDLVPTEPIDDDAWES